MKKSVLILWLLLCHFVILKSQNTSYSALFDNSSFNGRAINNSKAVGAIAGDANVGENGAGSYTIPIDIPIGTNGHQPNLALNYSSQSGNGVAGYGWHLSGLSSVTRGGQNFYFDGKVKGVNYTSDDAYYLDGMRLIPVTGTNGANNTVYGFEAENYSQVTSYGSNSNGPDWFKVFTKEGLTMEFGNSQSSKVINNYVVVNWLLNRVIDNVGNYYEYVYQSIDNEVVLKEVLYTGNINTGLTPYNRIEFNYSTRDDRNKIYDKGLEFNQKLILDKITMKGNGGVFYKSYDLKYGKDKFYSYLKEVIETGLNGEQFNSTIFKYGETGNGLTVSVSNVMEGNRSDNIIGDFNGDGISDIAAATWYWGNNWEKKYQQLKILVKNPNTGMYYQSNDSVSISIEGWEISPIRNTLPKQFVANDFNGDGLDDILMVKVGEPVQQPGYDFSSVEKYRVYFSQPNTGNLTHSDFYPLSLSQFIDTPFSDHENFFLTGDFDGDGKGDFISIYSSNSSEELVYYKPTINSGQHLNVSTFSAGNGFTNAKTLLTIDFNGDGKSDILRINNNKCEVFEILNDGNGNPYLHRILNSTYPTSQWHQVWPGDFNGDGKTDLVVVNNTGVKQIAYSNGLDWVSTPFQMQSPFFITFPPNNQNHKLIIGDYNGDGKSDIIHCFDPDGPHGRLDVYYSKGIGFEYESHTTDVNYNESGVTRIQTGDFNGDGKSDVFTNLASTTHNFTYFNANSKERLLHKVKNGFNQSVHFEYQPLTSDVYWNGFNITNYPLNIIRYPIYVVSSLKTPNLSTPSGNTSSFNQINYSYTGARMHRAGKGFLGFEIMTSKNLSTGITTISKKNINTTYFIPIPFRVETYTDGTNVVLSTQDNSFDIIPISGVRYKMQLSNLTNQDYLQNVITSTSNTYDNYGNVTQTINNINNNYETITTSSSGFQQYNSTVPNLPSSITVVKQRQSNTPFTKTTSLSYTLLGQLQSKTEFSGLPKAVTTTYNYSPLGNLTTETVSATGLSSRIQTYNYDSKGRFVTRKAKSCSNCTPILFQRELFNYNNEWGWVSSVTSSDCLLTQFEYDGFGRKTKTILPTGIEILNHRNWMLNQDYMWYEHLEHPSKPDQISYADYLGREVYAETELMNGQWSYIRKSYNLKGQIVSKTNLGLVGGSAPTITNITYDDLGRITSENDGTRFVNYAYNYNTTNSTFTVTKTGSANLFEEKTTDAAGKVIKSTDHGGDLTYTYRSSGATRTVSHNGVQLSLSYYDNYDRQIQLSEKNSGNTTYDYNAYGELVKQTDANGNVHEYEYDGFGRTLTRTGPEGTTSYQYYCRSAGTPARRDGGHSPEDETCCNNNITQIVGFNGITQNFTYDDFGRMIQKDELVDGINYRTKYTYNNSGNLLSTEYPSAIKIVNSYDVNGYLAQVHRDGDSNPIYTVHNMNERGQITEYSMGNGQTSTQDYFDGFPTRFHTPSIQDLNFDWDYTSANLMHRRDDIKGLQENFTYDDLNRLTSAEVSGQITYHYNYDGQIGDTKGNISGRTDVGNFEHSIYKLHAQNKALNPISPISPPQNISPIEQNLTYTPFRRIEKITEGNYEQTFDYWPEYQRVKSVLKNNGVTTATKYYFGNYEKHIYGNSPASDIHYVNGADGICAIITKNGGRISTQYVYKDHLGSLLTLTNTDANIVLEQNFDAWGRHRNPNDWTYDNIPETIDRGFTGHEHMPEFALINMNARLYDPVVGKMISPDNYVADPFSSQAYNRYAYANNNPLIYTDPDGNLPILVPIIVGAVIGAYIGGSSANGWQMNPVKWNYQSGKTWAGIGIGAGIGALGGWGFAAGAPALAGTSFFASFGTSGTIAAYTLMGGVTGSAVGYSAGFAGGMLRSNGNLKYSHQSAIIGLQVGAAIGTALGGIAGLATGYEPPKPNLPTLDFSEVRAYRESEMYASINMSHNISFTKQSNIYELNEKALFGFEYLNMTTHESGSSSIPVVFAAYSEGTFPLGYYTPYSQYYRSTTAIYNVRARYESYGAEIFAANGRHKLFDSTRHYFRYKYTNGVLTNYVYGSIPASLKIGEIIYNISWPR